jgi:hypothetical protein
MGAADVTRRDVGEARIRVPQRISKGDTILVHSTVSLNGCG